MANAAVVLFARLPSMRSRNRSGGFDPAAATPEQLHRRNVERGLVADPAQLALAERLTDLRARLLAADRPPRAGTGLARVLGLRRRRAPVRGLYVWGGVGRGKTYLVDLFHESLPFADKRRAHFHRFMRWVHDELRALAGRPDPLLRVADRFARQARVLCFDEFAVSDIGDAMILGELLGGLFARGVTLVATSNTPPERLYENGLQRRRFLAAIDLIRAHTDTVQVAAGLDYRLRVLRRDGAYRLLSEPGAETALRESFRALCHTGVAENQSLAINGRALVARYCAEGVAWFDFAALCDGARGGDDYIELARLFSTVVLHGVPVFDRGKEDQARRFVVLVDEFYDRNVKLLLSAWAPPGQLYRGTLLTAEFARTASRLREMQGEAYLHRTHRP